ncbi:MAG: UDP-N-acetylmuramoyl-L-alanine--D-glutamate ligase [Acidimicrobiales bacterium]
MTPVATSLLDLRRVVVVGFATTGRAVVSALKDRGVSVVVIDDSPLVVDRARISAGTPVRETPDRDALRSLAKIADLVVVSPGVPPSHPIFGVTGAGKLVSEIELASRMTRLPIVAVTGTNGKTSVVNLVNAMLRASGQRSVATGNIGLPLISAARRSDLDVLVAEVSSFQLALSPTFRPSVGTWLNFAPNHLDWHASAGEYLQAKAQIWAHQRERDVAVANADDEAVASAAARAPGRVVTFGLAKGDYRVQGDDMVAADGTVVARANDLVRNMPHDRLNALAALATAFEAGATRAGVLEALHSTAAPPHRLEFVGTIDGVSYYDDSKATTPAAVAAALAAFSSVVVILGGKNKGLDLDEIKSAAQRADSAEIRGIVAIGESAEEIGAIFSADYPVRLAASMGDAVRSADSLARDGDAVLLSPGCASFDWYSSYEARGEDFKSEVHLLAEEKIRR